MNILIENIQLQNYKMGRMDEDVYRKKKLTLTDIVIL